MKRLYIMMLASLLAITAFAQSSNYLTIYILDNDGPVTNIRNSPGGGVVAKLSTDGSYSFAVSEIRNGWMKVVKSSAYSYDDDKNPLSKVNSECWVHSSVTACNTLGDGGVKFTLRQQPSASSAVSYTSKEYTVFRVVDLKGAWVKVKTIDGKHSGWIRNNELCGNPVTTCG